MQIPHGKKIYFSSDNHLGAPSPEESLPREKKFVRWLDTIKHDAAAIFLLGDLFDHDGDDRPVPSLLAVAATGHFTPSPESGFW